MMISAVNSVRSQYPLLVAYCPLRSASLGRLSSLAVFSSQHPVQAEVHCQKSIRTAIASSCCKFCGVLKVDA
ncbi:hypothetical protein D9M69_320110 [compost metagenome]